MSQDSVSSDFTPPEIEEIATLLPAYEILSFLAKGGMGAVYHARQKSLDREVAIKVLPRHFSKDDEFRTSFETEAKSMAKFNHPNLIGIYDFGQVDGLLYIIMEVVKGESLYHHAYGKTFAPDEASRIVTGICNGLASAHSHGILHRDIKPANILLDDQVSPKIGDFGLARPVSDYESDTAFGTPGYTSPEVVANPALIDESTDLYSVGVILYELLTGKVPDAAYIPAASIVGCDPKFDQIIRKATHPTPAMRYRKAGDISKALADIMTEQTSSQPAAGARMLVTPGSTTANTVGTSPSSPRPAAPVVKTSSGGAPFLKFIIIIGLLGAIYYAWETLQTQRAEREKEVAQTELLKEANQKKTAQKTPTKTPTKTQSSVAPPTQPEEPKKPLEELRSQLLSGDRSELPKDSFTNGTRTRLYIDQPMTWLEANVYCAKYGGYLAVFPDEADLNELSSRLEADQTVWLGGSNAEDKNWRWIDGTPWKHYIRRTSTKAFAATDGTTVLQPKPGTEKHGFFIEWNQDERNHIIAKAASAPADELTPLRRKCAKIIKELTKTSQRSFMNNVRGYEQDLKTARRNLSQKKIAAYKPGLDRLTSNYLNHRIPADIPRTNMPESIAQVLTDRLKKQALIESEYMTKITSLREKYHTKLREKAKESGNKAPQSLIETELTNTSGEGDVFIAYILNSK